MQANESPVEETGRPRASRHAQTLSRGIRALEVLAAADEPLTIAALAAALEVHRSIAYRILRTLEDHGLVRRDDGGRVLLGPGLAVLARGVYRDLQSAAVPELTAISNELGMTTFLVVLDAHDVVTLVSIEPRAMVAAVAQKPGTRHPLADGAPGIAIQSRLSGAQWEALGADERMRAEAREAARLGYADSHDEVLAGMRSIAAPLTVPGQAPAALAVVYVASAHEPAEIGARLAAGADAVASLLR